MTIRVPSFPVRSENLNQTVKRIFDKVSYAHMPHPPRQPDPYSPPKTDRIISTSPPLQYLETQLRIHKSYLSAVTTAAVLAICLVLNGTTRGGGWLTDLCAYLYPAYMSLKAMGSGEGEVHVLWLGYWCIFGFFTIVEYFVDTVLELVPYYFTFQLLFVVWLVAPQTQGSILIYHLLLKHLIPIFDAFFNILLPEPVVEPQPLTPADYAGAEDSAEKHTNDGAVCDSEIENVFEQ
ncbi:ER membrane protein DP1/Yop1 [Borealophlyctis nickersoniae]|nr:ER membrane protein DP1/Yop1 [Borealophlyctis nickersoniae]